MVLWNSAASLSAHQNPSAIRTRPSRASTLPSIRLTRRSISSSIALRPCLSTSGKAYTPFRNSHAAFSLVALPTCIDGIEASLSRNGQTVPVLPPDRDDRQGTVRAAAGGNPAQDRFLQRRHALQRAPARLRRDRRDPLPSHE